MKDDNHNLEITNSYSPVRVEFGIDFTLASLRPNVIIDGNYGTGIVLHRQYLDYCFADLTLLKRFPISSGTVSKNINR